MRQPHIANTYVPSLASRQNAPSAVQPLLNAFPLPNGPDLGNGTAAFAAGYSDPSTLNASSIRIDYLPAQRATIFGRYSNAPSRINIRGGTGAQEYGNVLNSKYGTQVLTLGSNQALTPRLTNEVRVNYSRVTSHGFYTLDDFGGATPPPDSVVFPSFTSSQDSIFFFNADSTPYGIKFNKGKLGDNWQRQVNVTDTISGIRSTHQMKAGMDYRRITSKTGLYAYASQAIFSSLANVLANNMPLAAVISRNDNVQTRVHQRQPFRPGHLESDAQVDRHLRAPLGIQRCTVLAERHSSVYRDSGKQSCDDDGGAQGHSAVAIRKKTTSLRGSA